MSQRKLLLPPFHGESAPLRRVMAEATEREVASWPVGKEIQLPSAHAGDHARGDPARRLRRARRRAHGPVPRAHPAARRAGRASSTGCRSSSATSAGTPAARFRRALAAVDELIYAEIADRRAADDAEERDDVLSLLLARATRTARR